MKFLSLAADSLLLRKVRCQRFDISVTLFIDFIHKQMHLAAFYQSTETPACEEKPVQGTNLYSKPDEPEFISEGSQQAGKGHASEMTSGQVFAGQRKN